MGQGVNIQRWGQHKDVGKGPTYKSMGKAFNIYRDEEGNNIQIFGKRINI